MSKNAPVSVTDGPVYSQKRLEWNELNDWADVTTEQKLLAYEWVGSMHDVSSTARALKTTNRKVQGAIRNPWVGAYISHLESQLQFKSILSREWLELEWLEQYRRMTGEIPIPMIDKDGNEYTARRYCAPEVISALKEIGKMVEAYPSADSAHSSGGGMVVNIDLRALGIEPPEEKVVAQS